MIEPLLLKHRLIPQRSITDTLKGEIRRGLRRGKETQTRGKATRDAQGKQT